MKNRILNTALLRAFAFAKIPLIFWINPSVVELDEDTCVVKVPLGWRTRNHLGSMYFGALTIGADLAGGLMAMRLIQKKKKSRIDFVFKDMKAHFLMRSEGHTYFRCEDGKKLKRLVERAEKSGVREEDQVKVIATCPAKTGGEHVAEFFLTISLKARGVTGTSSKKKSRASQADD